MLTDVTCYIVYFYFDGPLCFLVLARHRAAKRYDPPLIAFGCGYSLPCCPRSNAFETATRAHRHLANVIKLEKRTDRRTDGQIAASLYAPTVGRSIIGDQLNDL